MVFLHHWLLLKYNQSMDNYVPHNVDYARYRKNYIEIRANKAGAKAKQEYDEQGKQSEKIFDIFQKNFCR